MTHSTKAPVSFWIISVVALLWNLMGTAAWFMEYNYYTNPASRSGLSEAMQPIYDTQPIWLYVVFAVAVLTGLIGCIGLLLRKSWCDPVFLISLIAVITLHGFNFFLAEFDYIKELGISAAVMPILVVLFAVFLVYYAKKNKALGILT